MRKRYKLLLGITAALLITWAIATAYYYNLHQITTKSITIDGWNFDLEGSEGLQFKDITLIDRNRKVKMPSESLINFLNKIPTDKLKIMAYRAIRFYSNPYEKDSNGWELTLSGIVVDDSFEKGYLPVENGFFDKIPKRIYIDFDNGDRISSLISGGFINRDSNILYFAVKKNDIDPNLVPVKISWYWDENQVFELELGNVTYKTKKYNYFDKVYTGDLSIFAFYREAIDVYANVKQGKKAQAELINDSNVLSQFETMRKYPNGATHFNFPTYIGNYQGHSNVFAMNILYQYIKRDNYGTADLYQTLYFVEEDGKWKLIDTEITDS